MTAVVTASFSVPTAVEVASIAAVGTPSASDVEAVVLESGGRPRTVVRDITGSTVVLLMAVVSSATTGRVTLGVEVVVLSPDVVEVVSAPV